MTSKNDGINLQKTLLFYVDVKNKIYSLALYWDITF